MLRHVLPFHSQVSFLSSHPSSRPPNSTTRSRRRSYDIMPVTRGDGPVEATCVQRVPFHVQVSPRNWPLATPPNSTTTPRRLSQAAPGASLPDGPVSATFVHAWPSNAQVSAGQSGGSLRPV